MKEMLSAPPRGQALHFGNHWAMLNTPLQAWQFEILLHFNTKLYFHWCRYSIMIQLKDSNFLLESGLHIILILKSANQQDFLSFTLMHGHAFFFSEYPLAGVLSLVCFFFSFQCVVNQSVQCWFPVTIVGCVNAGGWG